VIFKLIPQDDVWRIINPNGALVSVKGITDFTRDHGINIAIHLSKRDEGLYELVYMGQWRPCMKTILFKYIFKDGRVVDNWELDNPSYDPEYPIKVYWVRVRRQGPPGVILGKGIRTPKKKRGLTHQEQRNAKRQKDRQRISCEIVRTPEIKARRADIKRQIAKFRLKYANRQTPIGEYIS
jgi:hypothetical protein